jgi:hypothetical protein
MDNTIHVWDATSNNDIHARSRTHEHPSQSEDPTSTPTVVARILAIDREEQLTLHIDSTTDVKDSFQLPDLTGKITLESEHPDGRGGFADVYKGVWHEPQQDSKKVRGSL